jgi:hypothetical protein
MGEWRYSSTLLELGTRWMCVQLHAPVALPLGQISPGSHCKGGWMGTRTGLDVMKRKIFRLRGESNPGRLARSLSLYRLSYSGSYIYIMHTYINK